MQFQALRKLSYERKEAIQRILAGTLRCFITFSCYGTRLHGDESGFVGRLHNVPGNWLLEADPQRESAERQRM